MKTSCQLLSFLILVIILCGCSASKRLTNRLEGQWQIARYTISDPSNQRIELTNIGTIDFNSNQTGQRNVTYSLFQNSFVVNKNFRWSNTDDYILLNDVVSDSAKVWIVIDNKREHQLWKSTNGAGGVQVLELHKPN